MNAQELTKETQKINNKIDDLKNTMYKIDECIKSLLLEIEDVKCKLKNINMSVDMLKRLRGMIW